MRSEPPQDSPLAFWISTPSIVAAVWTGNVAERLVTFSSSTPASVTILNVEPGGCGADWAIPASASTSPLSRAHGRDPAVAAGERLDRGGAGSSGRSWCAPSGPGVGLALGQHAVAGEQRAAGRAGQALVELALEAGQADRRARRARRAASSSAARSLEAGPIVPAISEAIGPRSDTRSGPLAIGVPSRASIVARGGSVVSRRSFSPRRRPG